jgi:hypothetical protein
VAAACSTGRSADDRVAARRDADLSVLTNLATAENIGTVVLNSSEMPPADTAVYEPDDAVTSIRRAPARP